MKVVHLILSIMLITSFLSAQGQRKGSNNLSKKNTVGLINPLMRSNLTFSLPTKADGITKLIGKYSDIEYEDWDASPSGWGTRYIWKFENGLVLTAQSDGKGKTPNGNDEIRAIFLETTSNNSIDKLVYGLTLNKTTKSECQKLFINKFQSTNRGNDTFKVYKDNLYTYLTFNSNGKLSKIEQLTFDLENAD
jgi:hypothetical protein